MLKTARNNRRKNQSNFIVPLAFPASFLDAYSARNEAAVLSERGGF